MLDRILTPHIKPLLRQAAKQLYRRKIAPQYVVYGLFCFSLICFALLGGGLYGMAMLFLLAAAFLEAVLPILIEAYRRNTDSFSERRADYFDFLRRICRLLLYAGFVFFFMVSPEGNAFTGGFLLLGLVLNVFAQHHYTNMMNKIETKEGQTQQSEDDFFGPVARLSALAEGSETLIIWTLMCLLPAGFPALSVIYGFICFASAIARVLEVRYHSLQ